MELNGYPFDAVGANQTHYINALVNFFNAIMLGAIFAYSGSSNLKQSKDLQENAEKVAEEQKQLLDEANTVMNAVSHGDLSKRITVNLNGNLSQLKNSINEALKMLSDTIANVINSTAQILSGTNQLANAAQALANGTTQQAANIEEISSSMNEIGSMAKTNNDNASHARNLAESNTNEITKGNEQMEEMLVSMSQINDTSSDVSKVIKVIDEIAFQTNLLALNAAVEAARAGKYGKGFAVVADEVRNLAARSAEAANDTTELIKTSISEVEKGVKNADETASILKSFIQSIEKVNDLVGEISAASQDQVTAVDEINLSMNQVNDIIQQNASISEETASSAQELTSQAEFLQELMNSFVLEETQPGKSAPIKNASPGNGNTETVDNADLEAPVSKQLEFVTANQNRIILDDKEFGRF
jgi:methyl-accepting chemotaxis protein